MALTAIGMMSSVSAQDFQSPGPTDSEGTVTDSGENLSLEGDDALSGGDAGSNDTADINVTVTSKVAIDISPDTLNYPFVEVGEQEFKSNRSFEQITIRNTGSEPIDRVWLNASTPTNDPFGSGSGNFDAGNFIQINYSESARSKYSSQIPQPNGDIPDEFHYVNRKEFFFANSDETPSILRVDNDSIDLNGADGASGTEPSEVEAGAIRAGGEEYYFALAEDSGCDGSGEAEIRVADTSSTSGRIGTIDFTDEGPGNEPRDYTVYDIQQTGTESDFGIAKGQGSGTGVELGERTYDLLTKCEASSSVADNEEHLLRTRFNVNPGDVADLAGEGTGGVTSFIFEGGDTAAETIGPNQFITLETAVEVPRGVDQGEADQGTLRVFVTSDNSAT
jgi:hypothetical protein